MKTVRDGQKVWPYCSECGCRLAVDDATSWMYYFVHHFYNSNSFYTKNYSIDARGCKCSLIGITRLNRWEHPNLEQYGTFNNLTPSSK